MSDKDNATPIPIPIVRLAFHNMRRGGQSAPPNTPNTPPVFPVGPFSITKASPLFGTSTPRQVSGTPTLTKVSGTPNQTLGSPTSASIFSRSVIRSAVNGKIKAVNRDGKKSVAFEGSTLGDEKKDAAGDQKGVTAEDQSGETVKPSSAGSEKVDIVGVEKVEKSNTVSGENRGTVSLEDSGVTESKEEDTAMTDPTTDDLAARNGIHGDETQKTET